MCVNENVFRARVAKCVVSGSQRERDRERDIEEARVESGGRSKEAGRQVWQQNVCWLRFVMVLIKFLTGARPKMQHTKLNSRKRRRRRE